MVAVEAVVVVVVDLGMEMGTPRLTVKDVQCIG